MSNWVTTKKVYNYCLTVESIVSFVGGETVNCGLSNKGAVHEKGDKILAGYYVRGVAKRAHQRAKIVS